MRVDHRASKLAYGSDKKVIADLESKASFPAMEVLMQEVAVACVFMVVQEHAIIPIRELNLAKMVVAVVAC